MIPLCQIRREEQAPLWHRFANPTVLTGLAEVKSNWWMSHTALFWLGTFCSLLFFFSQFLQLPDALADRAVKSHLKDKGIQSPNFPLTVLSELNQGVSYVRYLAPNQGSWRGKGGFSCLSGKTFPLCCCFQWHLEA